MYGHRARIGYTSPPVVTEVFPYEFYRIAPEGVTLAVSTLVMNNITSEELQASYDLSVRVATEMGKAGVDLVVLGGVPINLCRGVDKVDDLIKTVEQSAGVPVTTSVTAQLNALRRLGARKLGVVNLSRASALEYDYLLKAGYEIVASDSVPEIPPLNHLGKANSRMSFDVARELKRAHPELDTLYFPCPHRPTVDAIQDVEGELNVNVVTASQAIIWEALRRCAIRDPIPGYGRLFTNLEPD
ncbi:MAG: hypothetical protein HYY01_03905 [Chloroflexi bacterium]|nr:hypothetical protein [Chloroflexota bacterium]